MQLNNFKNDLIREFKKHFSHKAMDFVVSRMNEEPYLDMEIECTLYDYFVIGILLERRTIFFTVREGDIGLILLKSTLRSEPGDIIGGDIVGESALKQLDHEVKLRIPDKYLKEKYSIV